MSSLLNVISEILNNQFLNRHFIEVGATLIDGSAVKITLDYSDQRIGTLEEYIEIGFKTKDKQGTLLQISSQDEKEYIILKVYPNTLLVSKYINVTRSITMVESQSSLMLALPDMK